MTKTALTCAAAVLSVVAIGATIAFTGGLPSQLAHLYYIPVVISAMLLPWRYSLAVAILAAVAVSPAPDYVIHRPLGMDLYYDNPEPWRLDATGWIVRPLAFVATSIIVSRIVQYAAERFAAEARADQFATSLTTEQAHRVVAEAAAEQRNRELDLLDSIDRMILEGAREEEVFHEIARQVAAFTRAHIAAIVTPDGTANYLQSLYSQANGDGFSRLADRAVPYGEGVSGWALQHGSVATSSNVFEDARYERKRGFAREIGYTSAAAAPITLNGQVIAAITTGYVEPRSFSDDEIGALQRIADQAGIAIASARQRESITHFAYDTAVTLSDAIEGRDPYATGHCSRLAEYARLTAEALGLDQPTVEIISFGAALHDIGNIAVPDQILKKADTLTPDEYAIVKRHTYHGGQICKRIGFLHRAYPIVYHHHERWDGRGYPDGLAGEKIPLGARIASVVDAFDAMTTDRPYREAMSDEEAIETLRAGAGTQWDPRIVDAFLGATGLSAPTYGANRVRIGETL